MVVEVGRTRARLAILGAIPSVLALSPSKCMVTDDLLERSRAAGDSARSLTTAYRVRSIMRETRTSLLTLPVNVCYESRKSCSHRDAWLFLH